MRSHAKVVTLLFLMGVALAQGEEAEATTTADQEGSKQEAKEVNSAEEEPSKNPEKRGLFRVTGVHGENPQQYQVVYTGPQGYQQPAAPVVPVEPRTAGAVVTQQPFMKPHLGMGYSAQPTYQQPYVLPSPAPYPIPYSAPTAMILLMMPPHPGNPYGSLMLVPANNFLTPNHIVPYPSASRVPIQFVPQYVPVPVKSFSGFPSAHFKDAYLQKPHLNSPQYLSNQNYQEQPTNSEEQDPSQSTTNPNYSNRMRPLEQYVKG